LRYVDEGRYSDSLIHRVARNFIVQGGAFKADGTPIGVFGLIASERGNGLSNTVGSIAMALPGNPPNINGGSNSWFINTGDNSGPLNPNFTVFGKVIFGLKTLTTLNTQPVFVNSEDPIRIPLIQRAVRVASGQFPILPAHTGSWFDPANPGRGFILEVAQASGSEQGPLLVMSWYDFHEGKQIWMYGSAPFAWGASSVQVPLQISSGAQFGSAFAPGQITADPNWGKVTVNFSGCSAGTWTYTSIYGDGTVPVRSLTLPTSESCEGQ
jgi:peptidyl-prolyl cis-trans isomerase A (cyclophilin A)